MRLLEKLGRWFDERLQLGNPIQATLAHPVPRRTASWFSSSPVFSSRSFTFPQRARLGTASRR